LFLDGTSTGTILAGTGNSLSFGLQTGQGIYTVTGSTGTCSENMVGTPYIFVEFAPEQATTPVGPQEVCQASTTEYSTEIIFASDTIYWNLIPTDAGIIIGGDENISIEWNINFTGDASLTAQGYNDCGYGNESDPLMITVASIPSPEITGLSIVCDEEESDYLTEDNTGSTYVWTVTGGEITYGSGTNMITVLWGDPGVGIVEVTETIVNDCSGSSELFEVTIDDCTAIDEIAAAEFSIYPNPAHDILNINFIVNMSDGYTIIVQNLLGQVMFTATGIGTGQAVTKSLPTSKMPEGQYFIKVEMKNGEYFTKNFIVIK
ncbi:MAG: T9SS type A sorting domain-containing protein, partial [Bacteroidota bacterium]